VKTLLRIVVISIAFVATFYFVYWVGGALIFSANVPYWIPLVGSALAAFVVARYVWAHTASVEASLTSSILVGALATGGIAFSAGFFGPILFAPGANQGLLLGIFVTGPLGFLLGAARWCGLPIPAEATRPQNRQSRCRLTLRSTRNPPGGLRPRRVAG
jgi:hypothetical protein